MQDFFSSSKPKVQITVPTAEYSWLTDGGIEVDLGLNLEVGAKVQQEKIKQEKTDLTLQILKPVEFFQM